MRFWGQTQHWTNHWGVSNSILECFGVFMVSSYLPFTSLKNEGQEQWLMLILSIDVNILGK